MESASLLASVKALLWGILRRFLLWLPFVLLDATEYWDRYIRPATLHYTGKDPVMPNHGLILLSVGGVLWAGVLTYHEVRQRRLQLESELTPRAEIDSTPTVQELRAFDRVSHVCYATVRNPTAAPLRNVCVYLTDISPRVEGSYWLPVSLRTKQDTTREMFDMNPRGLRRIAVFQHIAGATEVLITPFLDGAAYAIPLADMTYIFTLRCEGENIAVPHESQFLLKLDHFGRLVCLPGALVNADKGLIDFNHDALIAMNETSAALTEMSRVTNQISATMERITVQVDLALTTPITKWNTIQGVTTTDERIRRLSPSWMRQLDVLTVALKKCCDLYSIKSDDLIQNLTGRVEILESIPSADVDGYKMLLDSTKQQHQSTIGFRQAVANNHKLRRVASVTRSMRLLGESLDTQLVTSARVIDSLDMIVKMCEEKT